MAQLVSEDKDSPSKLVIKHLEEAHLPARGGEMQHWQVLSIELISGKRTLKTLPGEETMICRTPEDEVAALHDQLNELLNGTIEKVYFEPSEPSFEMTFERARRGGVKVEVWLDAGNGTTGIYTWDAGGIRFITTNDNMRTFLGELRVEFSLG